MSWFGSVVGVAKVGVGLLNGILNGTLSSKSPITLQFEGSDETYRLIAYYVLVSEDVSRMGRTFVDEPMGLNDVTLTLLQNGSSGKYSVYANNTASVPYFLGVSLTNPNGNFSSVAPVIPPGLSADVSTYASQYQLGDLITTPQSNNGSNPSTNPIPVGLTLLGNWILRGILGGSVLTMFADTSGQATLTWVVGTVGGVSTILNFTVNNPTSYSATITVILSWENPQTSLTFTVSVGPGGSGSSVLPSNASAITSASIAATTSVKIDLEERNKFLAKWQEKQYGIKLQKCVFPKSSVRPDLTKLVSALSLSDKKALAGLLKRECDDEEEEKSVKGRKSFF